MSKMITRTVTCTKVNYKEVSFDDDFNPVTSEKEVVFDGKYSTIMAQGALEKAMKGKAGAVKVTGVETIEKVYGISIEDFLKYAKEVKRPPSQRKNEQSEMVTE